MFAISRSFMASSGAADGADAALASAVLERERARMSLEDLRSWVAQRHWVGSLQVPGYRPMTWETAFNTRHNDLLDAHSALEQVRDLLQQNEPAAALEIALDAVGPAEEPADEQEQSEEEDEQEQSEEEELDDNPAIAQEQLLNAVQLPALAAPFVPFSGRCFQLDNA